MWLMLVKWFWEQLIYSFDGAERVVFSEAMVTRKISRI